MTVSRPKGHFPASLDVARRPPWGGTIWANSRWFTNRMNHACNTLFSTVIRTVWMESGHALYDIRLLYGSAMCCVPRAPAAIYVFQLSTLYDVIESWVPTMHKLTTMNLLGLVPRFLPLAGMTVYPHHRAASSTGVLFPALPGPRCALLSPSCVHLIRCPKPTRRAFLSRHTLPKKLAVWCFICSAGR